MSDTEKTFGKVLVQSAWQVLVAVPWALMLSCGVNLQQNGYRDHSNWEMNFGVAVIAAALAGWRTVTQRD